MITRPVCPAAENLIKSYEQCRLTAYQDGGGRWTIGWGYAGAEVHEGMVITQEIADHLFDTSLSQFSEYVSYYVKVVLTDNQFGALVSFAYNTGLVSLSKVAANLNNGKVPDALAEMRLYIHDNHGNIEPGLVTRRNAEIALFQTA